MGCIYRYTVGSIPILQCIRVRSYVPTRDTSGTEALRDRLLDESVYAYLAFETLRVRPR